MSLLQEATFERLLPRYERAFGGPPPFRSASLDEVIAHMRDRLRALDGAPPPDQETGLRQAGFARPGTGQAPRPPVH